VQLSALNRYPVKSCHGQELSEAIVASWGLVGDRRWMLVDDQGAVVTGREHPVLVQVRPEIHGTRLRLHSPGRSALEISAPDGQVQVPVQVWKSELTAAPAPAAAHEWFSTLLGRSVRLVYLDDPARRAVNPEFAQPNDVVSFADGYPLLLATEESLAALNDLVLEGPNPDEAQLEMARFRPNVVIRGSSAWEEDDWARIRIGSAVFRAVKACDRCVFTTIHPESGVKGREPLVTLARHRRWDGKIWFGMNLIPDIEGDYPRLRVGDDVEVLERRPARSREGAGQKGADQKGATAAIA
jgi:uncharacterized protein YcbX